MASELRTDVHIYPLYLKFAADQFQKGDVAEGLRFFAYAREVPRSYENKVYKRMWKIHNEQSKIPAIHKEDREYGRKAFHGFDGFSSTAQERAMAIELLLRKMVDGAELARREGKVHGCLWELHGKPTVDLEYGKHAFNSLHGRSASFEQKINSIIAYAHKSRLCSLSSTASELHLIQREDGGCETVSISPDHEKVDISLISMDDRTSQAVLSRFRTNYILDSRGLPAHYNPSLLLPKVFTLSGNKELVLCQRGGAVVWRFYDPATKKVSCASVSDADIQIIRDLSQLSQEDRASAAFDYDAIVDFSLGQNISVSLKKVSLESVLDSSKNIDRDSWAVTLVSYDRSSEFDPGFGHAMILYEGVVRGNRFLRRAHLTTKDAEAGYAKVYDDNYQLNPEKIRTKSPTWLRPRRFVEKMKVYIQSQATSGYNILFNQSGNPELSSFKLNPHQFLRYCDDFNDTLIEGLEGWFNMATFFHFRQLIEERQKKRREEKKSALARDMYNYEKKYNLEDAYGENCLTWTRRPIGIAGIELPAMNEIVNSPDSYISWISSHPQSIQFRDY